MDANREPTARKKTRGLYVTSINCSQSPLSHGKVVVSRCDGQGADVAVRRSAFLAR